MPNSKSPPLSTDSECASQAASPGGRSAPASTKVPTRSEVVAPAASASAGSGESNCMPSGIIRVA